MKKLLRLLLPMIILLQLGVLAYLVFGWPPNTPIFMQKKTEIETTDSLPKQDSLSIGNEAELPVSSNNDQKETTGRIPFQEWISSETTIHFPILMYHSLTESEGNSLKIPPVEFKEHLAYLKEAGYYTLTPAEAYLVLTENKKPADKVVWLTFDDGYLNNYTDGFPLLKEYQMHATINYIVSKEGHDNYFNLLQMKEMAASDFITIESHTMNHLEVNVMDYNQQLTEFSQSKQYLDDNLNQDTILLCYPAGRYDENNFQALADAGYKMAVTTEPGYASATDGLFSLKRVRVSPGYNKDSFGDLINSFQ